MSTKSKTLWALAGLSLVDTVIPIPFTGLLLIYVVIERPPWFISLVHELYG